jgi:ABC-type transporter Mla maintaining outer membrane lipid asymmetry ATPase subunit MlaF
MAVDSSDPLIFTDVEKSYGGLRPLRIRDLRLQARAATMLIGFDRPAAEVFVNLVTAAALPDKGEILTFGRPTSAIADSKEWLSFVEHFGIYSDRIVLLDAMSVLQNLALSFDLALDPVPAPVVDRVRHLAREVGIDEEVLASRMNAAPALLRSRVLLARALALDPKVLVLEHPSASLEKDDAATFARLVRAITAARALTTVALLMDEGFAKTAGDRLLSWQPATGEMRERRSWRFPYF